MVRLSFTKIASKWGKSPFAGVGTIGGDEDFCWKVRRVQNDSSALIAFQVKLDERDLVPIVATY